MSTRDWIIIGCVIALFPALMWWIFGKDLLKWIRSPKLSVELEMRPPFCTKSTHEIYDDITGEWLAKTDSYQARMKIVNHGRSLLRNVQVYFVKIVRDAGETFERLEAFDANNLYWDVEQDQTRLIHPSLDRGEFLFCRLGHVDDPSGKYWHSAADPSELGVPKGSTVFNVDTILDESSKPGSLSYLVMPEVFLLPGKYRMTVRVAAENARPVSRTIDLHLEGRWYDKESEMWGRGITLRIRHE